MTSSYQVFCFYSFEAILDPGLMTLMFVGNDCLVCLDCENLTFFFRFVEGVSKGRKLTYDELQRTFFFKNGWK